MPCFQYYLLLILLLLFFCFFVIIIVVVIVIVVVILSQLENSFQSHQLPDNAMVFQPPRSKTEVLKPVNFLGKAKVCGGCS